MDTDQKVLIVEGKTDKKQVEKILKEDVTILCTYGTFSLERFDELIETYDLDNRQVYILVDEDDAGLKLRKEIIRELPHGIHLHVDEDYGEVAETPEPILATLFARYNFQIDSFY